MEYEIFNSENCYICNELMGSFKSALNVVTGYSERPIYQIIEAFSSTELTEDIINGSGVCQNCFIKFDEYDEHLSKAEQIQSDLLLLMENKMFYTFEGEPEAKVKYEKHDDLDAIEGVEEVSNSDPIEYEPYETEEIFMTSGEDEDGNEEILAETVQDDFHFEIVVDDTKENKKQTRNVTKPRIKNENQEFIIIEMDDNQKAYQCEVCFKTFKDKSKLRTHREIHTDERNVICPVCAKAFKTMNCLRNHKRLHVPERTYFNCDQCEKRYTQKIQLRKHIEIVHMQRRDFVCNTCGASFGTNSVLKMHVLSHQDYRAEKCEICGFRFHTKAKLRRHMKSHTGERNYECSICSKKFLYSYNVVAHIRNVHERNSRRTQPEAYTCKFCNEKCWNQHKLIEHMADQHQHFEVKGDMIEEECLYEFVNEKQD